MNLIVINRYLESFVVREMDKRDDQEPFIPLAGSFMNPVNQPPPSMPPPPYETYYSISTPTAPYPTDFNTNETLLNDSEQNDKDVQNKGFIIISYNMVACKNNKLFLQATILWNRYTLISHQI